MQKVCVIGAGPSGITAIKNLIDKGLDVTAYDFNQNVGGNWIYNEKSGHSSVFETTNIISSKTLSQYEDFTFDDFDKTIPDYPSHDQLRRYFQAYAKHFDLYPYIQFNTLVKHCKQDANQNWVVVTERDGQTDEQTFSHLVVCNGHHWNPRYPEYPGEYTGRFLHSHDYKKAEPFRGERVLVIGGGNSACDVAVETSRVSQKTTISWRRGYQIIPKFLFGKPSDVVSGQLSFLPQKLRYFLSGLTVKTITGSNDSYGLEKPKTKFGATHPTINDELLYKLRHGKVFPKGDIERYDGKTVVFKDGSSEEFDTIVACTGYILSHPFFDKDFIDYSDSEVPLYLKMFHGQHDNLIFIGMFQPLGCIWPGSELQAKLAARAITGEWQRPKNIAALCEKEVSRPHVKQINTPRHTITVDYHRFVRQLKKNLPKNYVSKDPKSMELDLQRS